MNRMKIPVIKGTTLRDNIETVVGAMTVEALVTRCKVPEWQHGKKSGYQRAASQLRVNRLATDIRDKKVDLPTAVLLSIRDCAPEDVLSPAGRATLTLDLGKVNGNDPNIYVVDGQHRIKALRKALESGVPLKNFKVPFVCMIGASEAHETEQFLVVNSNAKSINIGLTLELLKKKDNNPAFLQAFIGEDKEWKVVAVDVAEKLSKSSEVWDGRIRFANMPKADTIIPSASMAQSLQLLFQRSVEFADQNPERQMQVLDAYWKGVRENLKDAFAKPKKYSIQKGIGVKVLHGIGPQVISRVLSKNASIFSAAAYKSILQNPLTKVEGLNGKGDHVSGVDFWKTGKEGAVGQYSSGAGIKGLTKLLESHLPPLEVK